MKRILTILIATSLISCMNQNDQKQKQIDTWNQRIREVDSTEAPKTTLDAPIDILELKNQQGLSTTSGVISGSAAEELCVQGDSIGFYGVYFLIDESIGQPFGLLKIHTTDEDWRFDSHNEKFAEITLESNMVAVWDSIEVGMSEQKLKAFLGNRFHYKKGTMIYSELDSYEGIFTLLNDTIKELTIRNNCKKKHYRQQRL